MRRRTRFGYRQHLHLFLAQRLDEPRSVRPKRRRASVSRRGCIKIAGRTKTPSSRRIDAGGSLDVSAERTCCRAFSKNAWHFLRGTPIWIRTTPPTPFAKSWPLPLFFRDVYTIVRVVNFGTPGETSRARSLHPEQLEGIWRSMQPPQGGWLCTIKLQLVRSCLPTLPPPFSYLPPGNPQPDGPHLRHPRPLSCRCSKSSNGSSRIISSGILEARLFLQRLQRWHGAHVDLGRRLPCGFQDSWCVFLRIKSQQHGRKENVLGHDSRGLC